MVSYFAKNLKVLRHHYKLSQGELARRLDIGRNKIASYEGRDIEPKLTLLIKMSNLFCITIDDMVSLDASQYKVEDLIIRYNNHKDVDMMSNHHVESATLKKTFPVDIFKEFTNKTESVIKMADGFRAYSSLYDEDEVRHPATMMANNILKVLDHLLDANKMIISSNNKQIE